MVAPEPAAGALWIMARRPVWDPRLLWATLALVAALLVGALIITLVDRWRKRTNVETLRPGDQLAQFRKLYEDGQLSAEEYDRVRGLLRERLIQEMGGAPDTAAGPKPGSVNEKLERMLREMRILQQPPQSSSSEAPPAEGPPPST